MRLAVLILIAVAIPCGVIPFLVLSDSVRERLAPVFCNEGEFLETRSTPYRDSEGSGTSITWECRDSDGRVLSDVTWKMVLTIFGVIGVDVLGTLVLAFALVRKRTPQLASPIIGMPSSASPISGQSIPTGYSSGSSSLFTGASTFQASPSADLTEKLRELKEALDVGLITHSEFDRKRQDILDKFS